MSDRYRSSAEAASEQLRLMKEAQLLQDQLKRSEARCDKAEHRHCRGPKMTHAQVQDF